MHLLQRCVCVLYTITTIIKILQIFFCYLSSYRALPLLVYHAPLALKKHNYLKIYSINLLLQYFFLAFENAEELLEINLGIWEGRKTDDVKRLFPSEHNDFWNHPDRFKIEQAESFKNLQDRSVRFVLNILRLNRGKTISLVSHSATIKVILAHFEGRAIKNIWKPPFVGNCSHSIIKETQNNVFEIVSYSGFNNW